MLQWLIERASEQNLDLHIAATRVLAARSEIKGKRADLYPHVDLTNNYDHVYYSKDALFNGVLGKDCCHGKRSVDFFELGFDAEWEIDLFGMTSREIAALKAQEEASQESLCDVWITLSAEVGRNYIQLRGLQQRMEILKKSIEAQRTSVELTKDLLSRGNVGDVDVSRAEVALNTHAAQKPLMELSINKAIYRLSILLGYAPGELYDALSVPEKPPCLPCENPITVPSDLLRRRPDIRRAERELAAATERIGAAIAALYPRFSLRGFIGDISTHIGLLFNPAAATWMGGPQILLPIFNSKLLVQDVDYNKNATQRAIYEYQKTVLEALEETENAIASFHFERERNRLLSSARNSNEVAYQLTQQLYEKGIKDKLAVLEAERELLSAEDVSIQSNIDLLMHYIALYKALGGSWQ
jgi:NodT family efflux transporter outer membrane factor (OMF) lipoprotein